MSNQERVKISMAIPERGETRPAVLAVTSDVWDEYVTAEAAAYADLAEHIERYAQRRRAAFDRYKGRIGGKIARAGIPRRRAGAS